MSQPTVYISFGSKDEAWKKRLASHLRVLAGRSPIDVWDYQRVGPGEEWHPQTMEAISRASVAIILVSAELLASTWHSGQEVPRLLERREKEGLRIFPVLVHPCAWQEVPWLSRLQIYPRNAQPLSTKRDLEIENDLATIARMVGDLLWPAGEPVLPTKGEGQAVGDPLAAARAISDPLARAQAFLEAMPSVPDDMKAQVAPDALNAAQSISDPRDKARMLVSLAGYVAASERLSVYEQALETILQIKDGEELAQAMAGVARQLPPDMLPQLQAAIDKVPDPALQARLRQQLDNLLASAAPPTPPTRKRGGARKKVSPPAATGQPVAAFLHSDQWTLDDQLNYSLYAKALAEFIYHPDTHPPLTIGILAPWGQGKTTMMHLVQYQLWLKTQNEKLKDPARKDETQAFLESNALATTTNRATSEKELEDSPRARQVFLAQHTKKPPQGPVATFGRLLGWLGELSARPEQGQSGWDRAKTAFRRLRGWLAELPAKLKQGQSGRDLAKPGGQPAAGLDLSLKKLEYPSVWFNAWKYQSSEQVWAGLAHAIISQLVEQIPDGLEREKFWFALQMERLDFNAIRQDIHRAVLERFLPNAVIWVTAAILGLLVAVVGALVVVGNSPAGWWLFAPGSLTSLLGGLGVVYKWLASKADVDKAPLEGKFVQYVRQPSYEGKVGFFHEVEQDIRRVFGLLVPADKPAVVFIDDLDRCSPGKVAEVIEAVNLFLSGDFPNCYFVLGADAQVVAASLEVAYEKLTEKLENVTRNYGSLGWYFMDKFIQLQFVIPNMTAGQRTQYLGHLFHQAPDGRGEMDVRAAEERVKAKLATSTDPDQVLKEEAHVLDALRKQGPEAIQSIGQRYIESKVRQLRDDDPQVLKHLAACECYLGASPRIMKRFTNLYRFYGSTQAARQVLKLGFAAPAALVPWLVIMIRWPQLVRWIQWEGEAQLTGGGADPRQRAEHISKIAQETRDYEAWLAELKKSGTESIPWLADQQLYEFIKAHTGAQARLGYAVEVGVW